LLKPEYNIFVLKYNNTISLKDNRHRPIQNVADVYTYKYDKRNSLTPKSTKSTSNSSSS